MQRPLLALPLKEDASDKSNGEPVNALLGPLTPTVPTVPTTPNPLQPNALRGRTLLGILRGGQAERILANGGLSMAVLQVGSRLYQLVVDLQGVPMVSGIGQLKSLILDSWIVASNGLAPQAGQLRVEEAVVRTLFMLMMKRVIGIRQLGPIREVLTVLNFVALAAASIRTVGLDAGLAATLAEISALPGLFYTAMARLVVDTAARPWILENATPALRREAARFELSSTAKGALGRNGEKLTRAWRETLEDSPELRTYTRKHAIYDRGAAEAALAEFVREVS